MTELKKGLATAKPDTETQNKINYFNSQISSYKGLTDTKGTVITIEQCLDLIKSPDLNTQPKIDLVRSHGYDSPEQKEAKQKLPVWTMSGTFADGSKTAENLIEHSRIIAADIDLHDNPHFTAIELKQIAENDPYTFAAFYSASGKSVCVLIKIGNPSKHEETYSEICTHYKSIHNIKVDEVCFKVNRLRFATYDPDLFVDEHSYIYNISNVSHTPQFTAASTTATDRPGDLFNASPYANEEAKNTLFGAGWKSTDGVHFTRPGKGKGVSATFGKVAPGWLYVFSSNAHPFDSGHAYNPFQIIALLNYNGDFSACASDLKTKYFSNDTQPKKTHAATKVKTNLLSIKTANEWVKCSIDKPIQNRIIGDLMAENELCILFADTGLGKSILSVQTGECVSKGVDISVFKNESQPTPTLYADFELSDKQFEKRCSVDYKDHYQFSDNFYRIEINPEADIPEGQSFEDLLFSEIEKSIIETKSKFLIIDNITYLVNEAEKSKNALPFVKKLKGLKRKFNLSILILAHCPKRDMTKPITRNDLAGSKMLINFCDSSFAIGESARDSNLRYIKQIKARNTEIIYDGDNVPLFSIQSINSLLQFDFIGFASEQEHLKVISNKEGNELREQIKEMRLQGKSIRQIACDLKISHSKVQRSLKQ